MEGPRRGRTHSAAHQRRSQAIRYSRRERHPLSHFYPVDVAGTDVSSAPSSVSHLRHGVFYSVIEVITNHREPQSLEAAYILMPTTENIQRIIRDFTPGSEKYSAAHLFFTDRT